ncbi:MULTISPECIES: N-acetylglucosamine/diacetylchitobiose ABC transporter substrate-binding protein [Arthrobacter]|uniref:N-acetylglucosamine transport system substrate-binding protein n=2 Tax=Arthrobacter TaxID=1663 RepID=A0AAW8DM96_9MICC|nr:MULTISPECIES: N-acetylglucosamine/diacetylchitobiose ABC transporter substrate-binding protein [Arthrobacter]MDP9907450.1 N-acetylglucosamine transport system substrate-binding protein [Arthrobacter bambusae]MDQ0131474.1 N-acetylglucosamine transport system substrate-binding protein [Arthrobacter bambusae]MDQ0182886.1 N-acetylglucosamine transport system substrate-binding protein [Arthrobacter bambusae]
MNVQQQSFARRGFLRGALAAAVLVPLAGSMASCAGGGGGGTTGPTGTVSDTNPFGMADKSTVDAVIFKGGYGIDYVDFAGKGFESAHSGSTAKISPSTDIAQELQPRFVGGNPPDLIDNSGAKAIGFSTILAQLEDLTSVVNAKNLEGKVIKDTLYGGVLAPGTFEGKLAALNYVLTVYAMWYSDALLKDNGWSVPKTWDEMYALGEQAKAKGKYLFVWGKEAATYYQEMAIASAIKEGGHDVRLGLENLKADCWSHPALQSVFTALEKIVKAGHFKPGGSGTQFTAAQAQWSNAQEAVFYPSGSWIENEMKDQTKAGFKMTGAPVPSVTTSSKLPYAALHSAAGEPFVVPSQGKNVPGGKELLRVMLSKDAATNFAKTKLAPTIVKDTVPSDGFGSTALVSQTKLLSDAGDNIYTWNFIDLYGTNKDQLVVWNTFLDGKSDVATLTSDLQKITDKVRNDSSVKKIEVK